MNTFIHVLMYTSYIPITTIHTNIVTWTHGAPNHQSAKQISNHAYTDDTL